MYPPELRVPSPTQRINNGQLVLGTTSYIKFVDSRLLPLECAKGDLVASGNERGEIRLWSRIDDEFPEFELIVMASAEANAEGRRKDEH